ncbi:DUF4236 domain-containing protein [Clostridium butyricum]|uniref:DUF4236 domain-containing protein n=1 Tax=Clostridium butyricum TaxID=1492 RepID=UPI003D355226
MSFRFRKSINIGGGFKINISKSGIGYSWGIPGYRVTKSARGNIKTTLSIPGTGISYVEEVKNTKKPQNYQNAQIITNSSFQNIESASIKNFQNAEYTELIESIKQIITYDNNNKNIMIILLSAFIILLLFGQIIFSFLFLIALILKFILHNKAKIELNYTIDSDILNKYSNKMDKLINLNNCQRKWQIIQFASVSSSQRKYNAGAGTTLNRIPFQITRDVPFFISTNIPIVQVKLKKEKLLFLPDKILIFKDANVGVIEYNSLSIDFETTTFIEDGNVPSDTQIVNYTWQYVNKNGSPDRRFNNNRKLPICLYYDIYITSTEGLNIRLQCSNKLLTQEFVNLMNT